MERYDTFLSYREILLADTSPEHDPIASIRFDALDSLRGICAYLVVLFHFQTSGIITNISFVKNGWLFVDFFFVLSGFVISASYGRRLENGFPLARFLFLRLGRIYPLHIVVLAAFLAMEIFGTFFHGLSPREPFSGSRTPYDLIMSVFLLQTFNLTDGLSWNNPSWSIAAEFWTYVAAGLVFVNFRSARVPTAIVIVFLTGAWLASTPKYLGHDADFGVVRCIFGFFLGTIAFDLIGGVRTLVSG